MFAFNEDKSKVRLDSLFKRVDLIEDLELSLNAGQSGGSSVSIPCPTGYVPLCVVQVGFTEIEGGRTAEKPSIPTSMLLNSFSCEHLKLNSGEEEAWVRIRYYNAADVKNYFRLKAAVIFTRKEFADSSMIDD